MDLSNERVSRELVRAGLEFRSREIWERVAHESFLSLVVPTEPHPLAAAVLGSGGMAYGLALTRGDRAIAHMRSMVSPAAVDDDQHEEVSHLVLTFCPSDEVPELRRGLLEQAGFDAESNEVAPLFLAKPPDRNPREIDPDEARTFLFVLSGLIRASEKALLDLAPGTPESEVLRIEVQGDPLDPAVTGHYVPLDAEPSPDFASLAGAPQGLADLPRLPETWCVGLPVLPAMIMEDTRTLRALLVAEAETGGILTLHIVMGGDLDDAATALWRTFLGDNPVRRKGIPERIVLSSRSLFDTISPALAVLGVACRYEARIPLLVEILRRLEADLFRRRGSSE